MAEADAVDEEVLRGRRVRVVLVVTLVLNALVALAKVAYGVHAGSLAIRADGLHSATDALNNVVLLISVAIASRPPDAGHPYGHRKFEIFAAGLIGLALLGVAWDVGRDVVLRVLGAGGAPPVIDGVAYVVLGVTLVVNLLVASYESRAARRLNSPALSSDSAHTRSDVVVTLGVVASTLLVQRGHHLVDAAAGAAIAGFIAFTGFRLVKQNLGFLVDSALVEAAAVERIAREIEGVIGAEGVRTRGVPGQIWMDLRIQVRPTLTVREAHDLSHAVADAIRARVPGVVDVHVHVEPALPPPAPPR